jgi:phosphate acetyltransferase
MSKTIFVASAEANSGKSIIVLGLLNMLLGKASKIGYFKPIINTGRTDEKDLHIQTIISHFGLPLKYEESYAFTRHQAMQHLEHERQGEMIDTVIGKLKQLEEDYDFTVIEGSDFTGEGTAFEFESNLLIAKNLCTPAILVVSGHNKSTAQIIHTTLNFLHSYNAREVRVLGIVVNKTHHEQVGDVMELLKDQLAEDLLLSVIPFDMELQNPTIGEICAALGGKVLFGGQHLSNQVDNFVTGAMQLPNFLNYITENVLIVTPGDRGDIIIGALQANLSSNYPKVSGIVLTTGTAPEKSVMRLIEGLQHVVPVISVNTGTFQTITEIGNLHVKIGPDNIKKIQLAINTFNRYINAEEVGKNLITYHSDAITPHMFQYQLGRRAKQQIRHIVLPEGNDDRILKAAARLSAQQLVSLTLLGDPAEIHASVKRLGITIDFSKTNVIDPVNSEYYETYAATLSELRKDKNLTLEAARDLMTDVSYFGTMMVFKGHADGMVSGATHTTQHTIRPALQFIKTRPGISIVSSVFFMCMEDRVVVFGDCAVNPSPTAEQLAEIAISSAETSKCFCIEPRIAMLSYSSGVSGTGEEVEKVRRATARIKDTRPDLNVEGPIQYDAAVDPVIGRQKMPGSKVAGQASVFIFPDLNTGNNTYKAVQRETGALAIGPILQGLNKPVNDLSRGCSADDIFNTVIITAIQSQDFLKPVSS